MRTLELRPPTRRLAALLVAGIAGLPLAAPHAHESEYTYLRLAVEGDRVEGTCDVSIRDVRIALDADPADVTAADARDRGLAGLESSWARHLTGSLRVRGEGGPCEIRVSHRDVELIEDGAQVRTRWSADCAAIGATLELSSELLFALDPKHRALVSVRQPRSTQTAVLTADAPVARFDVVALDPWRELRLFLGEGVHHIWIGLDHVLFLIALLLPAVRVRESENGEEDEPRPLRAAFLEVVRTVTAFTVAHSITLALVTLGGIALPSRWVEAAIAASVLVAAVNNLRPFFRGREWQVAFAFGLIHGFGFASVLADLGLPETIRALGLFAFNVGVELGQLAIVAAVLPALFALRRSALYERGIVVLGSFGIAWLALVWLVERLLGIELLSAI